MAARYSIASCLEPSLGSRRRPYLDYRQAPLEPPLFFGHRGHFTPQRLSDVLTRAGLEVETLNGAGFPFFNLYRLMVVARGDKLIHDASSGPLPLSAQAAMRAFSWLFQWNSASTQRGWQLVATAREPLRA